MWRRMECVMGRRDRARLERERARQQAGEQVDPGQPDALTGWAALGGDGDGDGLHLNGHLRPLRPLHPLRPLRALRALRRAPRPRGRERQAQARCGRHLSGGRHRRSEGEPPCRGGVSL